MIVLGITGSVGMGKSTVCRMLQSFGLPIFDADATVHRLFAPEGLAVAKIAARYPAAVEETGAINRRVLGAILYDDPRALKWLESVVHPLVQAQERAFVEYWRRRSAKAVVLDIPLLYETRADRRCDCVAVVSAPPWVQKRRVLARPGMTIERFRRIVAKQMPDAKKCLRADWVIETGAGWAPTRQTVHQIVETLLQQQGERRKGKADA